MDTQKLIVSIDTLHEWDKNPRNITPKDFDRLVYQIKKLGQYKPLIVMQQPGKYEFTVLGGNMRLKAYRSLGVKDVWVSVVEPQDENEMVEYALSDNDRVGYYDEDMLGNLSADYAIDWNQYAIDLTEPKSINQLLDDLEKDQPAIPTPDEEKVKCPQCGHEFSPK